MGYFGRYVTVREQRGKARRLMEKLKKQGIDIQPVVLEGRTIARSFWGKGWCKHIESFSDYSNRLPRGTRYVRNGSVCHLEIVPGEIHAIVSGSELYRIVIQIKPLKPALWEAIKQKCAGQIGSILELLKGRLSDQVMQVVTDAKEGLFPLAEEIDLKCDCPDWAYMCKHLAATLYGVGARLDSHPELLFLLRGVDPAELIESEIRLPDSSTEAGADALAEDSLSAIFDVELDEEESPSEPVPIKKAEEKKPTRRAPRKSVASKKRQAKRKASPRAARPKATSTPLSQPTGTSVARLRKELDMPVSVFAAILGVTSPTIYRWEKTKGPLKLQEGALVTLAELQRDADKEK